MKEIINVRVGGTQRVPATYTTTILRPNQGLLDESFFQNTNTKYIIKWNYDLQNTVVHIPLNCLIEFDGGSFSNGILDCQDTILITYLEESTVLKNVELRGDYHFASSKGPNLVILSEDEYEDLTEEENNTVYLIKEEDSDSVVVYSGSTIKEQLEDVIDAKVDKRGNTVSITYPEDFIVQTDLNSDTAKEPLKNVKYEVRDSKGIKLFEFWAMALQYLERPPQYTVTFNTNGGNAVASQTVEVGTTITLPTPTKSGNSFDGWYLDSSFTGNKLSGGYVVTSNITLYAKWKQIEELLTMYSFETALTSNFTNSQDITVLTYNRDTEVSEENWNSYHYIPTNIPITVTTMEFGQTTPTLYGVYDLEHNVYKIEDINLAGTIIKYN